MSPENYISIVEKLAAAIEFWTWAVAGRGIHLAT